MDKSVIKVRLDVIVPVIMIPACLVLSTLGPLTTVVTLASTVICMCVFYHKWKTGTNNRTKFFFVWGLTSVLVLVVSFELVVFTFRKVLLWEHMLLLTSLLLMFRYLILAKSKTSEVKAGRSPYKLRTHAYYKHTEKNSEIGIKSIPQNVEDLTTVEMVESNVNWIDSRPMKDRPLGTWCDICSLKRPYRSGHCNVCNVCISVRDHHCVWIDECIGSENHHSFLLSMIFFVFSGFYGFQMTLTSICTPEMYFDWFLVPTDCRFLYFNFWTAFSFVCACYTAIVSGVALLGLLRQLFLISQNLTSQEFHVAVNQGRVARNTVQSNLSIIV